MPLIVGVCWLHRTVHEMLAAQAHAHAPNETGGLLLGYRHSLTEIVITDAIGPGPDASHRRTGFDPDTDWQTRELGRRYAEAGRRIDYLGDWHTHPGGTTTLSRIDRRTLCGISRHPDARCPRPLMAILAGGDPWIIAIQQMTPRRLRRGKLDALGVRLYV